jgi:hypothetical protein
MVLNLNATDIYGASPVRGPVGSASKVATGGRVTAPSASATPIASATVENLIDDPAFWLVVLIGAAAAAAIYAAS